MCRLMFVNKYRTLTIVSMTTLQVVLDWLHDKGPLPGIRTSVDARYSAVPIMDGTPKVVGQLINILACIIM